MLARASCPNLVAQTEHLLATVRFGRAITRDAREAEPNPNPNLGVGFFKSILEI